ncbi:MAG: hypothetical protein F6K31_03340 [Symploca sp. SIO2G7]|nr:hypothetical protein [Symploca sp. SIO2G7]
MPPDLKIDAGTLLTLLTRRKRDFHPLDSLDCIQVDAHIWVSRKLPWVVLPEGDRIFDMAGDWLQDYASDPERYLPQSEK